MRTQVHASGFSWHGYRRAGAIDDLLKRATGEYPSSYNMRAPGVRQFQQTGRLPSGRLVGQNGTVMAHLMEEWPPISRGVDVADRRQRVAVSIVVVERVTAVVMPMAMRASLGRTGDRQQGSAERSNRSQNDNGLPHHRSSKTALSQTNIKPARLIHAVVQRYRFAARAPSRLPAGIPVGATPLGN
jgi:hypothetical protein